MKKCFLFLAAMMTAIGMNLNAETVTDVKYIDADGKEQTCAEATVVGDSLVGTWNAGWYVVMKDSNVTFSSGAICKGEVHLILADGGTLTTTGLSTDAGIQSSSATSSISIYGQANQTGKLIATGGTMGGAGIGGANSKPGMNITINGGVIEATGGGNMMGYAAGIGGGGGKDGSNITINGGKVTAISSGNGASAIGAGDKGKGSNIFVNPALILKADNNNPPTTEIAHASIATDVASLLAGKQYATVLVPAPAVGEQFTAGDVNYKVTSIDPFEAQVANNKSYAGNPALVIPDTVVYKSTKLAVTSFVNDYDCQAAFGGNKVITSVNITGNIRTVGSGGTFNNCSNLSKVVLNEGIVFLDSKCFKGDSLLDSITFPASLKSIDHPFSVNLIKWIDVAEGSTTFASEEGVLYNAAKDTLLFYPAGNPRTEFEASKDAKVIGQGAFNEEDRPYSISLPSVEVLETMCFMQCPLLTSVEFSDKIDSLGMGAFAFDTLLTTITCRATTPPALGEMVFYEISDLSKITLYVPSESVATYQAADTWKEMNVQPLPETAVENVNDNVNDNHNCKFMHNGQLYIRRGDAIYDAKGQVIK